MSTNKEPIKLRIPRQDLAEFKPFGLTVELAARWADGVSMGNAGQAVQTLRNAVSELNRIELEPALRYDILEALRPVIHLALSNLSKYYLNQPVVLPEEPRKAARLAQNLYELTTTAYTIVGIHAIQRRQKMAGTNPAKLLCQAIHRAISTTSQRLLIFYQLYQPLELSIWEELHHLYQLALRHQLISQIVTDEISGNGSVRDAYLRALMMGCCKANQLRQRDLAGIYKGLGDWVSYLKILEPGEGDGLFLVDLASDHPPIYGTLYKEQPGKSCRFIGTDELVDHLQNLRDTTGDKAVVFDKDTAVSANVLDHLISSWGVMSKRNFARAPAQEKLWVSVGLSNTHYYVSGGINFDDLVSEATDPAPEEADANNPFLHEDDHESDVWVTAFDAESDDQDLDMRDIEFHIREAEGAASKHGATERHPVFPVRMVNVSPGGYCLEWSADIPSHIKTGDVISVREVDNHSWSIAVIRWVSHLREDTTILGVELLSPRATPFGARVQHKTGDDGELMRALLLPEIKLVGQPNTLITPRVGFKERQKVTLVRGGEESHIQLFKKVSSTAAYSQFEFRYLQQLEEVAMRDRGDVLNTQYESLWNNI